MNLQEAKTLVAMTVANWPQMQDKDMSATAKLWATMLADIPYETAKQALIKVLATARYFPTMADIREALVDLTQGKDMTADEAWGCVVQAIRRYGYYQPEKGMATLPREVRAVVEHFGWRELCASEEPDVIRGQFRMAWEARVKRARELATLPPAVRQRILELSAGASLPGLPEEVEER